MKKYEIGIIGYGDFTKVLVEFLSPYADIIVSSRRKTDGEVFDGVAFASVQEVLSRPVIIPSIPAQYLEKFFSDNVHHLNPEALVIDVCSVKTYPLEVLSTVLPNSCKLIGTHPMFGPASISKNKGIKGLKCVVCPNDKAQHEIKAVINFLSDVMGLEVIEMSAEQHDREMAYVQGLSHYIGRIMQDINIPESPISTLAYDDLVDMKNIQGRDSWDLFKSIMEQNPYALQVNEEFKIACQKLDKRIIE